ncbi:ABC transporter substrate-binding protein [Photorhabdus caribbeanensis]|uniref:ABC transporter substrate-binding protein n=1 Tax=Photorhabdus caribbeanensis TaxID=1004165 RepID=UPI001BD3EB82|nr:ABC transporter substrate-binding protein [Photorhabdus caribbeanensis]MBS9425037.1 hypothetical protein [Photorhabdus caribbeanensis]
MKTSINIGVDSFPYNPELFSVSDYSGEQIFLKTALPLFYEKGKEIICLAARDYFMNKSGKIITINIRNDIYWSNGEKVTAEDYCHSIRTICRDKNNRYNKLLTAIKGYEKFSNFESNYLGIKSIKKYTLTIELKYKDVFFLNYLCVINISPMHKKHKDITAGPYKISEINNQKYKLTTNRFYKLCENKNIISTINYMLIEDDKYAERFRKNDIDVSCDTGLDLNFYRNNCHDINFKKNEEKLITLLTPGTEFFILDENVKHILTTCINKKAIDEKFNNMLNPIDSYLYIYDIPYIENKSTSAQKLDLPFHLSIAYEDFYPNKEILLYLKRQLSEFNIILEIKEDNYGQWVSRTHLRFEIRKSLRCSPILLIKTDISRGITSEKHLNKIKKYYSQLIFCSDRLIQEKIFSLIDLHLRQQCAYIPLFIFPTGYFCTKDLSEETLMTIGEYITRKVNSNDI